MTKITNKDKEKYYFEMFRKVYPLPQGNVIHKDKPDFRIGGNQLGIEMTNFYLEKGNLSDSEQVQRKLREEVVSDAQKLYQKENRSNIVVIFGFDNKNPIRNRKLDLKLFDLVKQIENQKPEEVSKETFRTIPELSFVWLNRDGYQGQKWRVQQVYRVPQMSRNRLLKIVRDKEKKARGYQKCDAYWLLVVVDFFDMAQDQEISFDGFDKIETGIFKKVIVYKTVFDEILEVK